MPFAASQILDVQHSRPTHSLVKRMHAWMERWVEISEMNDEKKATLHSSPDDSYDTVLFRAFFAWALVVRCCVKLNHILQVVASTIEYGLFSNKVFIR